MSKYLMGVDPGTVHTGWAVVEVQGSNINRIVAVGETAPPKASPPKRINEIIRQLLMVIDAVPMVTEIWTEFFVSYGARKGAMWNTTLVGALLYLPVTRQRENLTCYGMYPATWKAWLKKQGGWYEVIQKYAITVPEEVFNEVGENPHIHDAVCLALYAVYGATDVEQVSNSQD